MSVAVQAEISHASSEADQSLDEGRAAAQGIGFATGLAVGAVIVLGPEKAGDHATVTPSRQEVLDVHHSHTVQSTGSSPGAEAAHQLVEAGTLAGTMALGVFVATAIYSKFFQQK